MKGAEITSAQDKSASQTLGQLGITGGSIAIRTKDADGNDVVKNFSANSSTKLQDLLNNINKDSGVNAFFDSKTGRIALSAKNSGEDGIVVGGSLAANLGLSAGAETANGSDAKFHLNGLEMTRSSNTFEVNGLEFTLKETTTDAVTFKSVSDTDAMVDSIVNFVDAYNKMIEGLNAQIREPKYRNFQPLSDAQRADMKENEIKQWDEKAKSGTLRTDPTITNMLSKMRTALMGTMGSGEDKMSLSSIGITTSKDYLANGKLEIDKDALKKAIEANPQQVEKMFTTNIKDGEKGFAVQLRGIAQDSQKVIANKAGKVGDSNDVFAMGRSLKDMNKQIEQFGERMKMVENRLWKQFSAMEQAINRANAQSAQLMNSLGGM